MAISIVEFLAPLKKASWRSKVIAAIYFASRYESADLLTTDEIKELLRRARIPGAAKQNLAAVLASAGEVVDSPGKIDKRKVWRLTATGSGAVRDLLALPPEDVEAKNDVDVLTSMMAQVNDSESKDYIAESIDCLRFGALRAAVVFLWVGAVRTLQLAVMRSPTKDVNASLVRHEPKARAVSRVDDFASVKESTLLLVAQDVAVLDKNERQMLEQALDLRNKCGHPGKYKPGPKKVSAFIEDVTSIVFSS